MPAMDFPVFPEGDLVHDRYFYFASFGAALLLALALEKLTNGTYVFGLPRKWLFATLALLLPLSYATASTAQYWRDNYTLFEHAYEVAPHNPGPQINYADELGKRGEIGNAIPLFEAALKQHPNNYLAAYGLARSLYELGLLPASQHYFQRAQQLNPNLACA